MPPSSKRRRQKQALKAKYAKVREDAQLADLIPTTPEGAVRNEVVASVGNAQLPELVRQAIRENWATPDCAKGAIVANLLEPFFAEREIGPDGKPILPNIKVLNELAKTLNLLDKVQHERDNPELAKGGVNVSIQTTLQATQIMRDALNVDAVMELTRAAFRATSPATVEAAAEGP